MAPKPPDQKRKRGRPAGAFRPAEDASSRDAPEGNEGNDVEEDSRPRKRGRKAKQDNLTVELPAEEQEQEQEGNQDNAVQPKRRGRPPKGKEPNAPDLTEETESAAMRKSRRERDAENTTKDKTTKTKGKAAADPTAEDDPSSSEPRRSGRERQAGQQSTSLQPAATPPDPKPRPAKRKGPVPARAEEEPPSSTPRRSGRDRRTWDPDRVYGSRLSEQQEAESTEVAARSKSRKQESAPLDEAVAASRARKLKPNTTEGGAVEMKRRGWPSAERDESPGEGISRPRKSKQKVAGEAEHSTAGRSEGTAPPKRRGRPKAADVGEDAESAIEVDAPPKRRGRPKATDAAESAENLTAARSETTAQPKRRGRPKASDVADDAEPSRPSGPGDRAARRGKSSEAAEEQELAPAKRKRKAPEPSPPEPEPEPEPEAEEASSESEGEDQPFRLLQETIRHIPRSTTDKWTPLDPASINAASALLAEAQRPVILRLEKTQQRREHASAALGHVTRRVRTKLIKGLPFPAPTAGTGTTSARAHAGRYEDEFDFERTVNAMQTLENTLNPLLHSVGLLEREIEREEVALAREYEHLHKLETNARSKAREWKDRARKEHVLAPGARNKGSEGGDGLESGDPLELVPAAEGNGVRGGLFKGLEDEELLTLSRQIGSHMESMKGNLQQIGGVVPAITKSKGALQQVLLKHLDKEQYETILLG